MLRVAILTAVVAVRPRANFDTHEDNMMVDIVLLMFIIFFRSSASLQGQKDICVKDRDLEI